MNEPEEPKIIVDDDYKEQVKKEKERLRKELESQPKPSADAGLPPASFPFLLSSLATQTLAALGQYPDPVDNQMHVNKPLAKHFIDTIAMLEEKTKGNLTDEEAQMVDTLLHEMRMLFVSVKAPAAAEKTDQPKSKIELP
jgi:hypothetical protein